MPPGAVREMPTARHGARTRLAAGLAAFCALSVVFLVYRDLFVPHARDTEVWLGFEVTGRLAHATAPVHWALFATGAWAFWTGRAWIWPAASVYAVYVAASHLIWNLVSPSGGGWLPAVWQPCLLLLPAAFLIRVRPRQLASEDGAE